MPQSPGGRPASQLGPAAHTAGSAYHRTQNSAESLSVAAAVSVGALSGTLAFDQRQGYSSTTTSSPPSPSYSPLEEPAQTEIVPPDTVPAVLRASHWITAQRGRSFEDRGLRVRVKVRIMVPPGSSLAEDADDCRAALQRKVLQLTAQACGEVMRQLGSPSMATYLQANGIGCTARKPVRATAAGERSTQRMYRLRTRRVP